MPKMLALFQKVHFWSIPWVYFLPNANILNFELFFRLFIYLHPLHTSNMLQTFSFCEYFKSWILTSEKEAQVGIMGGGRWFGQCPRKDVIFFYWYISSRFTWFCNEYWVFSYTLTKFCEPLSSWSSTLSIPSPPPSSSSSTSLWFYCVRVKCSGRL